MERSTVTGKGRRQLAVSSEQLPSLRRRVGAKHLFSKQKELLTAHRSLLTAAGFTLLELMIVISILIILVSVALPQYQKTTMHARETILRHDLVTMRKLIDEYSADKGKLPQSLDDLVSAGYMREVPKDPITDNKDWTIDTGDDPYSTEGGTGVTNVHSSASEVSTDGTPYSEW
jgi:general secretion pathway protein G